MQIQAAAHYKCNAQHFEQYHHKTLSAGEAIFIPGKLSKQGHYDHMQVAK